MTIEKLNTDDMLDEAITMLILNEGVDPKKVVSDFNKEHKTKLNVTYKDGVVVLEDPVNNRSLEMLYQLREGE